MLLRYINAVGYSGCDTELEVKRSEATRALHVEFLAPRCATRISAQTPTRIQAESPACESSHC